MTTAHATVEAVWTFDELWISACKYQGRFIPRTTFRDWLTKACLIDLKTEYTLSDYEWVCRWLEFQKRYPRRSTVKIKRFHQHMKEFL